MDPTYHSQSYQSVQTNQSTNLRKIDLNSGSNLISNPVFHSTTLLNGGTGQATLNNDDINQRTQLFGHTSGHFGHSHSQHNLSQSMDSSQMSVHSGYHSPKQAHKLHQQQQPQLPSLLQKNQPTVINSRAQPYTTTYGTQGVAQPNYYGVQSTSSIMSSKGSEYFQTPSRMQSQATPFTYQTNTNVKPNQTNNIGNFQFNRTLYESQILVRIKSQDREEFTQQLGIKIVIHAQQSSSQQQVLAIELTDDSNPYFLYSLECSESDFHVLRQQLQLKIDFQAFPQMFIAFLEQCSRSNIQQDHCKYYCMLELGHSNEAHFFIIQPTEYREIHQLNLVVKQANDEGIKKYLANKLKEATNKIEDLQIKLSNVEDGFSKTTYTNDQIMTDLQILREENRKIVDQMKIDEQKKINEVTQKMLLEAQENQARFEVEKRDIVNKNDRDTRQLIEKLEKLQNDHSDLVEAKRHLDNEYKEYQQNMRIKNIEQTQKIDSLQHELNIVTNQLNELREANKNLDSTKYTQEKSITEYTLKYQALHRELEDKEYIIQNLNSHLETAKTQKVQLEEQIESLKAKTLKMDSKLEQSIQEIKKAQSYISKIESKNKQYKQKLKLGTAASKQYEQALQQKQEVIDEQVKALNDMKRDFDRKESENRDMKSTTELLQTQLSETKKTIESNQQTILYLNQRLTEKGGLGGASYSTVSKPPTASSSSFKPSFTSLDQLQSNTLPQQRTTNSYERSPFRNISATNNNLQTPSSVSSMSSANTSQMYNSTAGITLKNQAAPLAKAPSTTAFTYSAPKVGNENVSANLPVQPQFVSKYTQQIYNQQTALPSNPLPLDTLQRQNSQTSLSSATSGHTSSVYSSASYQQQEYGQTNTMSFNPYQTKQATQDINLNKMNFDQPKNEHQLDDYLQGNNDTQMSNNEAFQAFLMKHQSVDDDE